MPEHVTLNGARFSLYSVKGVRQYETSAKPAHPTSKAPSFLTWQVDGYDLNMRAKPNGYLGRAYGVNTDGRNIGLDQLGPLIQQITLSTYDQVNAGSLLGSTDAELGVSMMLGSATPTPSLSTGFAAIFAQAIWYGYIIREQQLAKLRLSDFLLCNSGIVFTSPATDIVSTKNQLATSLREVSVGLGDSVTYKYVKESNVGQPDADTWADNSAGQAARVFGLAPDRTVLMADKTVKGNIQSGSVTMGAPNWQTVATLTNFDLAFTGFVMDGNIWILGSTRGPLILDPDLGEFRLLMEEIDYSTENCRQMSRWFPVGAIIPLREGTRYSDNLSGESWGVERFIDNYSPVQGYPTGGDGSVKWYMQALYNPIDGDTYLIQWRPRQQGELNNPHPLSPYIIAKLAGTQCRWVEWLGTAGGVRTNPTWLFGYGANAAYITAGRTNRDIDDVNYRNALSGITYLTEVEFDQPVDIEAFEFEAASCSADKTIQMALMLDRATAQTIGSAVVSNGHKTVLAVSGGVPDTNALGGTLVRPEIRYASNVSTSSPQVLGTLRMRYRPRPKMLKVWKFSFLLEDPDDSDSETLEEELMSGWGSGPVLLEDPDQDSVYISVDSVKVDEISRGSGSADSSKGMTRVATITATEWQTS